MSIYVKFAFGRAGGAPEECWVKSGHSSLGKSAYAAEDMCRGYYLGTRGAFEAYVVTVTTEEQQDVLLTLDDIVARIVAAETAAADSAAAASA